MGQSRRLPSQHIAGSIRQRIDQGGDRVWRLDDFQDLPFEAVAQALSRLARSGAIERLNKGTYYKPRQTAFGRSRPNPASIQNLAARYKSVFPSGIVAANLLGFSTQTARQREISTTALSLPRKLVGSDTIVHSRRPASWNSLQPKDAALLEFLRSGGNSSELSPEQTIQRTLNLLAENDRYGRLAKIADSEPPRVRAMLGALGEQLGKRSQVLRHLSDSLNPFSKFDFGVFGGLKHATKWQARKQPAQ